jgi:hypothetical protein
MYKKIKTITVNLLSSLIQIRLRKFVAERASERSDNHRIVVDQTQ